MWPSIEFISSSVMQAPAPPSPSSVPRPSVFHGQALVAQEIGGEAKRRKSEDIPRGFAIPSSETCMTPANVRPPALSCGFTWFLHQSIHA